MAFKVQNSRSRNGGNSGNNSGSETIAVRIKSVHVADPKNPSYDNDYAIGVLLHNALGIDIEATRNDDWLPTQEVKIRLKAPTYEIKGDNTPYAIADLRPKSVKGNSKPMGNNPIILFERAYLERASGDIVANWIHVGAPDSPENPFVQDAFAGVMAAAHVDRWCQVYPERTTKDAEGKEKQSQTRIVYLAEYAERIQGDAEAGLTSEQAFIEKAHQWLIPNPEAAGGTPAVVLRIASLSTPEAVDTITIYPTWENNEVTDPRARLQKFLDDQYAADTSEDKDGNWKTFIQNIDSEPDYVIEMIPVWQFNTGLKSLPSARQAARGGNRPQDHEAFRSYILNPDGTEATRDDGTAIGLGSAITKGHMMIRRKDGVDGITRWTANQTVSVKPSFRSEFHQITDLPTAATPPELVARFEGLAAIRMDMAKKAYEATQAAKNTQSGPASDEGTPAHDNGLAGSSFSR